MIDGFVKSPISALSCILRHCGVLAVRLTPQDLLALILNFLRSHPKFNFLRVHLKLDDGNNFRHLNPVFF